MDRLSALLDAIASDIDSIDPPRQAALASIASWLSSNSDATLLFVCTHNSRRSQIAEVLAAAAAARAGLPVKTRSAGTEVTAFHPSAIAALERLGFDIARGDRPNTPIEVRIPGAIEPKRCFSKRYDDQSIPRESLAAIMVCDSAEAACPNIPGADARFSLTYRDPKESDGSPQESETYDQRCLEIAREMLLLFKLVRARTS